MNNSASIYIRTSQSARRMLPHLRQVSTSPWVRIFFFVADLPIWPLHTSEYTHEGLASIHVYLIESSVILHSCLGTKINLVLGALPHLTLWGPIPTIQRFYTVFRFCLKWLCILHFWFVNWAHAHKQLKKNRICLSLQTVWNEKWGWPTHLCFRTTTTYGWSANIMSSVGSSNITTFIDFPPSTSCRMTTKVSNIWMNAAITAVKISRYLL